MSTIILIAESDPFNLRLLQEVCEAAGHSVVTALDGTATLSLIARRKPDLVLIDVGLAPNSAAARTNQGGLEVLKILKSDPELTELPVLVTAHIDDVESRRDAITLGAEDYIARPFRVFEIQQRIRNALRRVIAERRLLTIAEEEYLDPLTRAGSATQMNISLEYEMTRSVRYSHPLSIVSVRIPTLEHLTAEYGRDWADAQLVQLTQAIRLSIRGIDHLFRGRRDEMVIVLPETGGQDAQLVARRLRETYRGDPRDPTALAMIEVGSAERESDQVDDGFVLLELARTRT